MKAQADAPVAKFLGIEGGATRTVALLAGAEGQLWHRLELGPANLKLLTDEQLAGHFAQIGTQLPTPDALAIGLAGAWAKADRERIKRVASQVWPAIPCCGTSDLHTALMAAPKAGRRKAVPPVLVLSGTGSACYGQREDGTEVKVGGWGHVLGDKGSGYDLGLQALRAVVDAYDQHRAWPGLGTHILRALALNEPNELIDWAQSAGKADIAGLAIEVFSAWQRKDQLGSHIVHQAAKSLARDGLACARSITRLDGPVQFILAGSVLLKQPAFRALVARELRQVWPTAEIAALKRESAWGAIELAKRLAEADSKPEAGKSQPEVRSPKAKQRRPERKGRRAHEETGSSTQVLIRSLKLPPTERRNPRSLHLDRMPIGQAVRLMLSEEARVASRVRAQSGPIARAVRLISRVLCQGGHLFYVGAGTSGRLGMLDASECPPTFGTKPEEVQGIIAGGQGALWQSVEGAEDDGQAGSRAIEFRGVTGGDVVVGIAASGRTPFVWGALQQAKERGAATVLVCCHPFLQIPRRWRPRIIICPNVGPEVLTGSTRLKAGTATKLILNLLTTLAMVRLGKVMSNLMVDLEPSNAKLRDRAMRIVQGLTRMDQAQARAALERAGWQIRRAVANCRRRKPPVS